MKEFKMDVKYWGTVNLNTEKHGFNTIVISGPCADQSDGNQLIDRLFKDVKMEPPNREYSIMGKHKAKGFVVHGMDCTDGKIYIMTVTKQGDTTIIK